MKHKSAHFKRGPSAHSLNLEENNSTQKEATGLNSPVLKNPSTMGLAIEQEKSSPEHEEESTLDRKGVRLPFDADMCPLPDEMDTCVLIPPPSVNGAVKPSSTQALAVPSPDYHMHSVGKQSSKNDENVGLKNKSDITPDPTKSLPVLTVNSSPLNIPRKSDEPLVQGTSLSPSTLLIEHTTTTRQKPSQTFISVSSPGRNRLKRVRSMPSTKRRPSGALSSEPVIVDRTAQVWNNGLIYQKKDISFSVFPCSCEMSSVEERGIEICSTKTTKGRIVLARLCKLIQNLLEERYSDLFSVDVPLHNHELTQLAICPICVENNLRNPTNFLVETCVHTLKENECHHCRYHPETVPLRDLVPDYLIVDFPSSYNLSVDSFEFNQSRPLHRSISSSLFNGAIRGQEVAVKMHSYSDGRTITGPLSNVRQEMEMLFHLKHPNIVRTFGFCLSPPCCPFGEGTTWQFATEIDGH